MIEVRFHGRGGQGAKVASRILGQSGFLCGLYAQDFALFGAERRGAPVVSCTRLSAEIIDQRGYIDKPGLVVVMDHSLLKEARDQVFQGVNGATPMFINGVDPGAAIKELPAASFTFTDLNAIARELMGQPLVSAAAAALAAKCVPAISLQALLDAVQTELAEFGLSEKLIEQNRAAARRAYALAPQIALAPVEASPPPAEPAFELPPELAAPRFAGPTICHPASALLRATGSWRTERPEIALQKCKRCFLCYLYCPDAAIDLDAENFPHIDYDHCKGCMICYEECPTDAITRRLEV